MPHSLTPEQRAVVDCPPDCHATVLAVAGSGKTTTMVQRIARLVRDGVDPALIRAVMFNKNAQLHFERSLARAGVDTNRCRVMTFHAMGNGIVRWAERAGKLPARRLIDRDGEVLAMLGECVREAKRRRQEPDEVERSAERCLQLIITWKSMSTPPKRATHPDDFHVEVYRLFDAALAARGCRIFEDQIFDAVTVLEQDPGGCHGLADRLEHIIVDEYQDVSWSKQRLLELIAGRRARVMIVGDDDQCIYEWLGARAHFITNGFTERFTHHPHRTFTLSRSFRFGPRIAQAAWNTVACNQRRRKKEVVPATTVDASRIQVVRARESSERLAADVADLLAGGRGAGDIIILGRMWAQLFRTQIALLVRRIPFRADAGAEFFRGSSIALLRNYLTCARRLREVVDEPLAAAFGGIVNRPLRYAKRELIAELLARARHRGSTLMHLLSNEFAHQSVGLAKSATPLLMELAEDLEAVAIERGASAAIGVLRSRVDFQEHFRGYLPPESVVEAIAAQDAFEEFTRVTGMSLAELEPAIAGIDTTQGRPERECVRLTVIHRVKGLEWPIVLMPEVNEGHLPGLWDDEEGASDARHPERSADRSDRTEAERRLFYVGITRAIEEARLYCSEALPASRFIGEAHIDEVNATFDALRAALDPATPLTNVAVAAIVGRVGVETLRDGLVAHLAAIASASPELATRAATLRERLAALRPPAAAPALVGWASKAAAPPARHSEPTRAPRSEAALARLRQQHDDDLDAIFGPRRRKRRRG